MGAVPERRLRRTEWDVAAALPQVARRTNDRRRSVSDTNERWIRETWSRERRHREPGGGGVSPRLRRTRVVPMTFAVPPPHASSKSSSKSSADGPLAFAPDFAAHSRSGRLSALDSPPGDGDPQRSKKRGGNETRPDRCRRHGHGRLRSARGLRIEALSRKCDPALPTGARGRSVRAGHTRRPAVGGRRARGAELATRQASRRHALAVQRAP